MPSKKLRRFCFTYFDESCSDFETLRGRFPEGVVAFIAGQQERCPTTQRIHWQAYVRFVSPRAFTTVKSWLPGAHLESCKGSEDQNVAYCSKVDSRVSGPFSFGTRAAPGKRKDIDAVREMVRHGKRLRAIADEVSSYQALRFASEYINLQPSPVREPPIIYWLHGSTGSGKTRWAFDRAFEIRVEVCRIDSTEKSAYFDPYVDHDYVLFDDFRPTRMPFSQVLAITDRYPMRVRVLYGTRDWTPSVIVFTCPYSIDECFKQRCDEDLTQLKRRISDSGGCEMLFGSIVKRHNYGAVAPGFVSL